MLNNILRDNILRADWAELTVASSIAQDSGNRANETVATVYALWSQRHWAFALTYY
jgi:hypothetical protein